MTDHKSAELNQGVLSMHSQNKIGFWWSDKKCQKLNVNELRELFEQKNCTFVKLDLERPLETQGPFAVIVHKLSDIMVKADQGDLLAKKAISAFENYTRKHPEVIVLDPLENNRILLDRYKQYRLIDQSGLTKEGVVFTPPFVHLNSTNIDVNKGRIKRSKMTFPVVCKPILAQGSTGAHQMCIIFNEAGLKDIKPPCVAQSFVNHNAKLFKLFVIKDKYYVRERPSLKNFYAGDYPTVFFSSHDISKPNSSSSLTELDDKDNNGDRLQVPTETKTTQNNTLKTKFGCTCNNNNYSSDDDVNKQTITNIETIDCSSAINQNLMTTDRQQSQRNSRPTIKPCDDKISKIVKVLRQKLGLVFFGVDIIIENTSQRHAIIDMNTFPGYDGIDSFTTIFRDVIVNSIPAMINNGSAIPTLAAASATVVDSLNAKRRPTEIDSGIESA